jgi:hypothetical protein
MTQFAAPATPSGIDWSDLNGRLLIIEPAELVNDITTNFGPTSAVRATITVIDGDKTGETYDDTLVFPKVLQSQLKSKLGEKVLGRLGQGVAKPGQSPPWVLHEATPDDVQTGTNYLAGQFSAADLV